jgi:hypothetical protein
VKVLFELFVEDGMLALSIVGVALLAMIVASVAPGMTAGAVLLFGSLFALFGNVMAVQKKR